MDPFTLGPSVAVYLGLGANLGDRKANLRQGLALLGSLGAMEQVSSLYETEPVGYTDQPRFLNAVCALRTTASPQAVLARAKEAERLLGRVPAVRYGPRTLDLDLLLYGDLVLATAALTIPHPRLAERRFVLAPLAEIAPEVRHPVLGRTAGELLAALPVRNGIVLAQGPGWWNRQITV